MTSHKPIEAAGLTGLFGLTFNEQGLHNQFHVLRPEGDGHYLVQLFSWIDGSATNMEVWPRARFAAPSAKLYDDEEEWRSASEDIMRCRKELANVGREEAQ
jgi:hypothetical protein